MNKRSKSWLLSKGISSTKRGQICDSLYQKISSTSRLEKFLIWVLFYFFLKKSNDEDGCMKPYYPFSDEILHIHICREVGEIRQQILLIQKSYLSYVLTFGVLFFLIDAQAFEPIILNYRCVNFGWLYFINYLYCLIP